MKWACERCGRVHTVNASRCSGCRHTVFKPLTDGSAKRLQNYRDQADDFSAASVWEKANRAGKGDSGPQPMQITDDMLYHGGAEVEYSSSPDVALDGSIVSDGPDPSPSLLTRLLSTVRFW